MVRIASKACLTTTPQSGKEFRVKFKAIAVAALSAAIICGAPAHADEVVVSAASSLTNAFKAAGQQYEHQHPGTSILFSFGSSDAVMRPIINGAPADVFSSADPKQMDKRGAAPEVDPATRAGSGSIK